MVNNVKEQWEKFSCKLLVKGECQKLLSGDMFWCELYC